MKPVKLELVLGSSFETVLFDWEHVNGIYLGDITTSEQIDEDGNIIETRYCKQFDIDVETVGGVGVSPFKDFDWREQLASHPNVFQINLVYEDGSKRECCVNWSFEWIGSHPWQSVEHCDEGYSTITCNQNREKLLKMLEEINK